MTKSDHLSNDIIVKLLDEELPKEDTLCAELHLAQCPECRLRHRDLSSLSSEVQSLIAEIPVISNSAVREKIDKLLINKSQVQFVGNTSEKKWRRVWWGMAAAAALAAGLLTLPIRKSSSSIPPEPSSQSQLISTLEVNGETFIALPYSNPDLPLSSPRIVEMRVPVSSLADAGVHFGPISNEAGVENNSVLADVLLGLDGQPLGVRVLSEE